MDRVRIGNIFRAIRLELRLRQADLAARAGVSQQTVSRLECGRFDGLCIGTYCRIAETLNAEVALTPRWRGPKLGRLLDRRHARLQNRMVEILIGLGWETRTEQSFNYFGDRGSVDVVGWRPDLGALLIVEIKSELVDLQETLRRLDVKARVFPTVARVESGWDARSVGIALVLPGATATRNVLRHHAALVSASLPDRGRTVRRWLVRPTGNLRGVWFLLNTRGASGMRIDEPGRRVRGRRRSCSGAAPDPDRPGTSVTRKIPVPEPRP